jgi:hypothetical protein
MKTVFPVIEAYGVKGPWKTVRQSKAENLVFFAGVPVERITHAGFSAKVEFLVGQRRLPVELHELIRTRIDEDWPPGVVLTDDYAPYDLLIGREAELIPSRTSAPSN